VAESPAPTELMESIEINKAYKCAFFSMKMLLKLPRLHPDPVGGAFSAPSNPLADVIGCSSCGVLTVFFMNNFHINVIH